jgi:hypothetical protein
MKAGWPTLARLTPGISCPRSPAVKPSTPGAVGPNSPAVRPGPIGTLRPIVPPAPSCQLVGGIGDTPGAILSVSPMVELVPPGRYYHRHLQVVFAGGKVWGYKPFPSKHRLQAQVMKDLSIGLAKFVQSVSWRLHGGD